MAESVDVNTYLVDMARAVPAFNGVQMLTYRVLAPSAAKAVEIAMKNHIDGGEPVYEGDITDTIVIGVELDE